MMECLRERVSGSFQEYMEASTMAIRDIDVTLVNPNDAYWTMGVYIHIQAATLKFDSYGEWIQTGQGQITVGLIANRGVEFRTGAGERNQFTIINRKEGRTDQEMGLYVNGQRFMGWEELLGTPNYGGSPSLMLIATTGDQYYEHLCIGPPLGGLQDLK